MSNPALLRVASNCTAWLAVEAWEREQTWLRHGFSTRQGGVSRAYLPEGSSDEAAGELNLGFTAADARENVQENRERFAEALTGSRGAPLIAVRQIHSNQSVVVDRSLAEQARAARPQTTYAPDADGLMTAQPGVLIGIQTADCIPVLVADPAKRAVAAFHAGWRGTVHRIVELGIAQMQQEFGSDPTELIAAIGPGIGGCCYTVGAEVRSEFGSEFAYAAELFVPGEREGEPMRLDLIEANRRQLLDAGLKAEAIATAGGCTACRQDLFFSHRASQGNAGRMMAAIGIR